MKVYLGGAKGTWREKIKDNFPNWNIYDPFIDSRQQAITEYTLDDLDAIRNCDLVLFYINYEKCYGICVEGGFAYALEIPIISVFDFKGKLPELLLGISEYVFTDLNSAIDFMKVKFNI